MQINSALNCKTNLLAIGIKSPKTGFNFLNYSNWSSTELCLFDQIMVIVRNMLVDQEWT